MRYSLRSDEAIDWDLLAERITAETGQDLRVEPLGSDSAVFVCPQRSRDTAETPPAEANGRGSFLAAVRRVAPQVTVPGFGRSMVVVKDVGAPAEVCARYGIPGWGGYQAIGHTRMATESAVTTAHSHPFAPAADLALVHNGSFSNYATIRGQLARAGSVRHRQRLRGRRPARRGQDGGGADLEDGAADVLKEMDGFFTLLVTTEDAVRGGARLVRLQADGDGGDRRLRRGGLRIRGAGRAARDRRCPRSSSRCPRRSHVMETR